MKEYRDEFYEQQMQRLHPEDVPHQEALSEPVVQAMLHQTVPICQACRELTSFDLSDTSPAVLCSHCGMLLLSAEQSQGRYTRELCRVGLL